MRIYYFVHLTGRDPGNTGIQRVVRGLGHALLARQGAEIVPVRWSPERAAIVHAEQPFLDMLARHEGPQFPAALRGGEPIGDCARDDAPAWLLVPEVPHLGSSDGRYPPVAIGEPLAYASRRGLRTAAICHDLLPLTHPEVSGGSEVEQLSFTIYAQGLVNADLVLPVSSFTGGLLQRWLENAGYNRDWWPRFAAIQLPDEIIGSSRRIPDPDAVPPPGNAIAFVSFGTICRRKNQLALLDAFNRLGERRPDLDLNLRLVGHCEPALVSDIAYGIRRSAGRAQADGYLPDDTLLPLIARSRATVFVSLAEGYGLPIAESLWLGTPCLCSNIGPMAEIAAGGGCMTVDPTDIEAIAAGIERLATDDDYHRLLLAEIAARRFRTWQDYASEVLAQLGYDDGAAATPPCRAAGADAPRQDGAPRGRWAAGGEVAMSETGAAPGERWFTIAADDLSCHDAYRNGAGNLLRRDGAIEFDAARHGGVNEEVMFFGPYVTMPPGIYLLTFDGDIDGRLTLRFTHGAGVRIREMTVDSFAQPVVLPLTERFEKVEILGIRSAALRALKLRSILVHHIDPPGAGA